MTIDIPALRKLCDEAVAGDWRASSHGTMPDGSDNREWFVSWPTGHARCLTKSTAQFIATTRTALPAALDEVERLRKLLDRACASLDTEGCEEASREILAEAYDH